MTQVMKTSDVRQQWSQLLNKVFRSQTRIVIEKSGIPVAAVISNEDLKLFTQLEKQRKERFKALDKMRDAFKDVPAEKIDQEIEKARFEIRTEKRTKNNRN